MLGWYRNCSPSIMRHLARGILVVVVLFVLALAGTLLAKSRTMRAESVEPAASHADLTIKDVEIDEAAKGVRWRLSAEQVQGFQQEGRTVLRKPSVTVNEPDRSWTIVGEEGEVIQQNKNVELRRNVVVTSSDGLRLETSVLRWQGEQQRLWTDAPVVISRDGSVIRGNGFELRLGDERTTVDGPVRATFVERSAP
jgi:LPS export ABC transporter protein LptC